jgi:hypothetical protein
MRYRALHTVAPGIPPHVSKVNKNLAQAMEITARRLFRALVSRGIWGGVGASGLELEGELLEDVEVVVGACQAGVGCGS